MKREIIETKNFTKKIDFLLKKGQLLEQDFKDFKEELAKYPDMGDLVSGTGGM